MTWQDGILILELVILFLIYLDDHSMKRMAKESLQISRESLEAQKQYLELRKIWYQSRLKKKENAQEITQEQKGTSGTVPSVDKNAV